MITWTDEKRAELRAHWAAGLSATEIAHAMGTTKGAIDGQSIRENLHHKGTRRVVLKPGHDAIRGARTLFPTRVFDPTGDQPIIKPGSYSRKLGGEVLKGHWRGFPIYTLALEERATCPTACALYASCYGNHMQAAKRYRHGDALIWRLSVELAVLQLRHPQGFVVRLHVLGDFYSVDYVWQWARWLEDYPALRVFGYTAWAPDTPIGRAVKSCRVTLWDRFAVRTSGMAGENGTTVVERVSDAPPGSIVCPAQTDKTTSCATCALCWATHKPITFLMH